MKKLLLLIFSLLLFPFNSFSQTDSVSNSQTDSSSSFHFLKYLSIVGGVAVGIGNYKSAYAIPNDGGLVNISGGIMYNHLGVVASVGYMDSYFKINTYDSYTVGTIESLNTTGFQTYDALLGLWIPFKIFSRVSLDLKLMVGTVFSIFPKIITNSQNFYSTPDYVANTFTENPYSVSQTITPNSVITAAIGINLSLRILIKRHFYAELPYIHLLETPYTSFNSRINSITSGISSTAITSNTTQTYNIQTRFINIGVGIAYRFQGNYGIKTQIF